MKHCRPKDLRQTQHGATVWFLGRVRSELLDHLDAPRVVDVGQRGCVLLHNSNRLSGRCQPQLKSANPYAHVELHFLPKQGVVT